MTTAVEQNPRVYISVLNWNRADKTLECLESLTHLEYKNYQVIVVDNDSHDDSVQHIQAAFPDLEILCAESNLGYAAGNNIALEKALADDVDLFWILNNDATVKPDTLTKLVEAYQKHGEALYGSVTLSPTDQSSNPVVNFPRKFLSGQREETLFVVKRYSTYSELFPNQQDQLVTGLPGSSIMMPLSLVRKHGFMDLTYFMYSEDVDYCIRLQRAGVPLFVIPTAIVLHGRKGSSADNYRVKGVVSYYQIRNQLNRARRFDNQRMFWAFLFKDIIVIVKRGFTILFKGRAALWLTYCSLLGLRDGLRGIKGKTLAPENYI